MIDVVVVSSSRVVDVVAIVVDVVAEHDEHDDIFDSMMVVI